jgi:hypothetical protein
MITLIILIATFVCAMFGWGITISLWWWCLFFPLWFAFIVTHGICGFAMDIVSLPAKGWRKLTKKREEVV